MDRVPPVLSLKNERRGLRAGVFRCRCDRTVPYPATRRSRRQVAAALAFALVLGFAYATSAVSQDPLSPEHPSSIRGTVINAVTGEPIGRALVYTFDNRFARFTDSEGRFDYPLPKTAAGGATVAGMLDQIQSQFSFCCIEARKPGFVSGPNQEHGTEIASGSEPVIALVPEGLIKGRVSLPSSDAAAGMAVDIFSRRVQDGTLRWIQGSTVQTNSNGEFRFAELRPGEYKIMTHELLDTDPTALLSSRQMYGFPPVYFPGAVDLTSASPIQLKAGQTFEAFLSPARQPYYPVRIPVADDPENGLVTVSIQGRNSPGYSLSYLPDRHSIDGFLPNGTYLVSMEKFGPNGASGTVTITVSGGPARSARMVLARHSSIQLNVTEEFTSKDENISGSWSSEKGTFEVHGPRLDLHVSVEPVGELNPRGERSIRAPSGPDDDTLVIEDVPPGAYRLRNFASRGYVASATAGGVDLLQEPLMVSPGSTPTVDIHLRDDFAEIDGSLSNMSAALDPAPKSGSSGLSKPTAYIYFVPQPGSTGQYQQTVAFPDGKFGIRNLAPGRYLVLAFEKQQMDLPYRDVEAMRIFESRGRTIRLAPSQKEKLELQIISSTE